MTNRCFRKILAEAALTDVSLPGLPAGGRLPPCHAEGHTGQIRAVTDGPRWVEDLQVLFATQMFIS